MTLDLNLKGSLRARLVEYFSNMFLVFKQYYTFFHPHVFQKNTNDIIQITLPNESLFFLVLLIKIYQ